MHITADISRSINKSVKGSTVATEYRSPNVKQKLSEDKSASKRGLAYRLANIKSTEKKLSSILKDKKSPLKVSDKLYQDAINRRRSRDNHKSSIVIPNSSFKNTKSKVYLISSLITDFNEASEGIGESQEIDFLKAFEVMKKLGFIKSKEKVSQAEINSDKALFMDFWQHLDKFKDSIVNKELLFAC